MRNLEETDASTYHSLPVHRPEQPPDQADRPPCEIFVSTSVTSENVIYRAQKSMTTLNNVLSRTK